MAPATATQLAPTKDIPNVSTLNKQAPKRQSRRRKFHHSTSQLNSGMCAPLYPCHGVQPEQMVMCQQMVLPAVPMANLIPSQWALYPDMKVYQQVPFAICPQYPYSAGVEGASSPSPTAPEVAKTHKKQEMTTANALATVTVNPIVPMKDLPEPTEMEPELDEPIDFEEDGDDMYDIDDDLTSGLTTGTATTEEDLDPSEDMSLVEEPVTSDDTPSASSIQGGSSTDSSPLLRPRPRSILRRGAKESPKRTVTFSTDTEFIERTLQFELEKANPSFRRQRKPRGFSTPTPAPVSPPTTALSPPPSASDNSGSENSGSDYPKDLQRALGLDSRKVSAEAKEEARKAACNRRRTRGTFQVV